MIQSSLMKTAFTLIYIFFSLACTENLQGIHDSTNSKLDSPKTLRRHPRSQQLFKINSSEELQATTALILAF